MQSVYQSIRGPDAMPISPLQPSRCPCSLVLLRYAAGLYARDLPQCDSLHDFMYGEVHALMSILPHKRIAEYTPTLHGGVYPSPSPLPWDLDED